MLCHHILHKMQKYKCFIKYHTFWSCVPPMKKRRKRWSEKERIKAVQMTEQRKRETHSKTILELVIKMGLNTAWMCVPSKSHVKMGLPMLEMDMVGDGGVMGTDSSLMTWCYFCGTEWVLALVVHIRGNCLKQPSTSPLSLSYSISYHVRDLLPLAFYHNWKLPEASTEGFAGTSLLIYIVEPQAKINFVFL